MNKPPLTMAASASAMMKGMKLIADGAGGDNHGSANAGEHSADADYPDAVVLEEELGTFDALGGEMFADEWDFGDCHAVMAAEGVEHAIAGQDAQPGAYGGDAQVHFAVGDEIAGQHEGNIFGQRDAQAAGEKQAEENRIAPGAHQLLNVAEADPILEVGRMLASMLNVIHLLLLTGGAIYVFQ